MFLFHEKQWEALSVINGGILAPYPYNGTILSVSNSINIGTIAFSA